MKTYNRKMNNRTKLSKPAPEQLTILAALGDLSVDEFMSVYWHRKPVLIRQAFKNFQSPVSPDEVLDLAFTDDAQARLIRKTVKLGRDQWRLDRAPLEFIPSLKTKNWTVLLQGADTEWDSVAALLRQFRFVSDARLDDLMISVASDGGGVGPHIDSYDVFLLQAHGKRHWRWGKPPRGQQTLLPDQPLKILSQFTAKHEATLDVGDMLYLPPGYAHDGVAKGACMTFSIGFRSATRQELTSDFLGRIAGDALQSKIGAERLLDDSRQATQNPAKVPADLRSGYSDWLKAWRPTQRQIDQFLGEHLSEPRSNVVFDSQASTGKFKSLTVDSFKKLASKNGLHLHRSSRALFDTQSVFINGESFKSRSKLIHLLFNQRSLSAADIAIHANLQSANNRLICADWDLLLAWTSNGWLNLRP